MTEYLHLIEHFTQVNIYLTPINTSDYIQKYNIYSLKCSWRKIFRETNIQTTNYIILTKH